MSAERAVDHAVFHMVRGVVAVASELEDRGAGWSSFPACSMAST